MARTRNGAPDEETALLSKPKQSREPKPVTPLPKLQIAILLLLQLAEPITSQCIYPFINQASAALFRAVVVLNPSLSSSASLTSPVGTRRRLGTMLA